MQRVIDWLDLEYCGEIRILHVQSMMIDQSDITKSTEPEYRPKT